MKDSSQAALPEGMTDVLGKFIAIDGEGCVQGRVPSFPPVAAIALYHLSANCLRGLAVNQVR